MTPRLLLAVDGGNSKTDLVLFDRLGRVRARRRGPGSGGGPAHCAQVITDLLADVDVPAEAVTHAVVAVAGLDFPGDEAAFEQELRSVFGTARVVAVNDILALLRAGTEADEAVAVVCGAGFNAIARGPAGTITHPAIGWASGEWGGGDALGRAAVRAGSRAADGRGEPTILAERVLTDLARPNFDAVARAVRDGEIDPARIGRLAKVVLDAHADGDPVAGALVGRQVNEIAALVTLLSRRAWPGGVPTGTPAVLGGGLFSSAPLAAAVSAALEPLGLATRAVARPPVLGAVREVASLVGLRTSVLADVEDLLDGATQDIDHRL